MPEHTSSDPNPEDIPADLKTRLKASYDAIALRYNEWTIPHSTTRLHYLDQLLSHLPTTSSTPVRILELGCGAGIPVTQKLLEYPNFFVTANDLSGVQIALARENLLFYDAVSTSASAGDAASASNTRTEAETISRLTLIENDMLALAFPHSSFSAVVGMYSIIHLPISEQIQLLRNITKWLKPGGFLLANFSASEMHGSTEKKWLGEKEGWMFWGSLGVAGTLRAISDVGLDVIISKVEEDEVDDASFLWVLAQKPVS